MNYIFYIITFLVFGYFISAWIISRRDPDAYKEAQNLVTSATSRFRGGKK